MSSIPQVAGIYKITCRPTGKIYIGSTTTLRKRKWWHWADLRMNRHHNRYLQSAWNKYGEQVFVFEVLETVMFAEHLHEREQYWVDHCQSSDPQKGFNFGKAVRAPWLGRSHSDETRQKLSVGAKLRVSASHLEHIRERAAEWHGSIEGRRWHGEHAREYWQDREATERKCEHCGAVYQTRANNSVSRFCTDRCKNRARYASGAMHEDRVCIQCGLIFNTNKYGKALCCSARCVAASRQRSADGTWKLREEG